MFFLFTPFNKYFIFSFFFQIKHLMLLVPRFLSSQAPKQLLERKQVLYCIICLCPVSELIIYIEYKTNQEPLLKLIFYPDCY